MNHKSVIDVNFATIIASIKSLHDRLPLTENSTINNSVINNFRFDPISNENEFNEFLNKIHTDEDYKKKCVRMKLLKSTY